ncbi:MAG: hypothetical protein A3F17_01880 [Gammaproteobacteria bacterium RIFCSPHIGHO2_12_FULL_41_15]|nr:MAG: hypothetical protein A3F17_01880 [Gammaproteobacteria bacterium RIFCSPHIGHO2_12_FULL_41_15]
MPKNKQDSFAKQKWTPLGFGRFNNVYVNQDKTLVLKIQIKAGNETDAYDVPSRSVALWNKINADITPPARVVMSEMGEGWVCPYIEGEQSTDLEIQEAIIDIYNRTGRIVVDAPSPKNFVTRVNPETGERKAVCIDIGMALKLEQREEEALNQSFTSLAAWKLHRRGYIGFLARSTIGYPETSATIKALLFIQNNRSDMYDVTFLKTNPDLVKLCRDAYDKQVLGKDDKHKAIEKARQAIDERFQEHIKQKAPNQAESKDQSHPSAENRQHRSINVNAEKNALAALQKQREQNLVNTKDSCIHALNRYIAELGVSIEEGRSKMSFFKKSILSNADIRMKGADAAMALIKIIQSASSFDVMGNEIFELSKDQALLPVMNKTNLLPCLNQCMQMVVSANKVNVELEKKIQHESRGSSPPT